MRHSARGAIAGALLGIAIAIVLFVLALHRDSPGGAGEDWMWLATYSTIWGLPLSLLWNPVAVVLRETTDAFPAVYLFLIASVPLNWALLGFLVGWATARLRKNAP